MVLASDSKPKKEKEVENINRKYLTKLLPQVFRTEGDVVPFDLAKIEQSLVNETGLDQILAYKITELVVRRIISSGIRFLSGPHIREIVCSILSEQHFEEERKLYTRIGMPLMDYEAILEYGVDENANQDMNPESIHHWAANRISNEYALLRILDSEEAHAHLFGDIHIHMLRYFDLRPFCVDGSTKIPVINREGILDYVKAKNFDIFFDSESCINISNDDYYFYTTSGLRRVNIVSRRQADHAMYKVVTEKGKEIILSKDHRVMVFNNRIPEEIPVCDLETGDKVKILDTSFQHRNLNEINLIEYFKKKCSQEDLETVYIRNLREQLLFRKHQYSISWGDVFQKAEILDYPRSWESGNIPILQAINLIREYNIDLTNLEIGVIGSPYLLPAILPITPYLLKLVGYFVSEGNYNISEGNYYNLVLTNNDPRIFEDMKLCIENSIDTFITPSEIEGKAPQLFFGGKLIYLLFKYVFGIKPKAENKSLADIFYNLSVESLNHLLIAMFSGDGHIVYRPEKADCEITYTSKSKSLINFLSFILSSYDIRHTIKREKYEYEFPPYQGEGIKYRIHIYGHRNIDRLNSIMGFVQQEKQNKLERFLRHHQPVFTETNLPYEYIKEIIPVPPTHPYVYDFSLEGNGTWEEHTFYAENILIHNCQEWDPRMILEHGLPPVESWAHCSKSGPAGGLRVAVTHLAKWLGIIQGEFSGGQGYDYITTFLAPYARGISDREIEQSMQCLIFETN